MTLRISIAFPIFLLFVSTIPAKPVLLVTRKAASTSTTHSPNFEEDDDLETHRKFAVFDEKNKFLNQLPDTKKIFGETDALDTPSYRKTLDLLKPLKYQHTTGFRNPYQKEILDQKPLLYDDSEQERFNGKSNFFKPNEDGLRFPIGEGKQAFGFDTEKYNPFEKAPNMAQRKLEDKYENFFQKSVATRDGGDEFLHPYRSYKVLIPSYYQRARVTARPRFSMDDNLELVAFPTRIPDVF